VLLGLVLPLVPRAAPAQRGWVVELSGGVALNAPTPLRIVQRGERDLRTTARYASRPFRHPLYYAVRVGRWSGADAWELELVHHKIYLRNPPPGVQHFEVSHGYNLLSVNRAQRHGRSVARAGAGVVIARPEATIRGRMYKGRDGLFGDGYHVAGPTLQLAASRHFTSHGDAVAAVEGKLTASYARIPVDEATALVPNVAAHGLVGVGYRF
jgi:hypothetical protein